MVWICSPVFAAYMPSNFSQGTGEWQFWSISGNLLTLSTFLSISVHLGDCFLEILAITQWYLWSSWATFLSPTIFCVWGGAVLFVLTTSNHFRLLVIALNDWTKCLLGVHFWIDRFKVSLAYFCPKKKPGEHNFCEAYAIKKVRYFSLYSWLLIQKSGHH